MYFHGSPVVGTRIAKYLDRFNSIFSLDVEPVFLRLTPHKGSTSGRSDYGNNFVLLLMTGYIELLTRKEVIGSLDFVTAEHSPREGEIML